jgi:hypothetical protein
MGVIGGAVGPGEVHWRATVVIANQPTNRDQPDNQDRQ